MQRKNYFRAIIILVLISIIQFDTMAFAKDLVEEVDTVSSYHKGDVINSSTMMVNESEGYIINGDFTQTSDATLELNIGSSTDGIIISGEASLGGALKLNFINNYIPTDEIKVMSYNSHAIDTRFSTIEVNGIPEPYTIQISDRYIIVNTSVTSNGSADDSPKDTQYAESVPGTGDGSEVIFFITMILLCLISGITMYMKKRENDK